jgi:phosphatidylglycerol lysyltransferase
MTALQLVIGLADIFLVSTVLYLLLPDSIGIGYLAFLGAYLAAVLVGVLSHVPAGLGVLESMLLLLLPHVPPEQLLAAVLLYRVIYEIVPVLCSLALWFAFEGFSRDGALLRVMGRQAPIVRPESPTIDRSE